MPITKFECSHISNIILHSKALEKQRENTQWQNMGKKNKHSTLAKNTSGLDRFSVESYQTFKEQF